MTLKKISDHPYLLTYNIEEVNVDNLIQTSAKLESTIKILNEVQSKNEKVIIFAEIKNTQKMLKKVIQEKFNLKPSIINGDTPSTQNGEYKEESNNYSRQTAIDKFSEKNGFNIIIMSPIAAGIGLNVTAANHVIHYSRHWNPAKE